MTLFSQRQGYTPIEKALQRESIDDELRNQLWNNLTVCLWNLWTPRDSFGGHRSEESKNVELLFQEYWLCYFKRPLDEMLPFRDYGYSGYKMMREYFFSAEWYQVYDFIEFAIKKCPLEWSEGLTKQINISLEEENSAYRIVGHEITEITDLNEINSIKESLDIPFQEVQEHLESALAMLSDRKQPNYRNSIKESISAVEALCKRLSGKPSATLKNALDELKKKVNLHPAFEGGLNKLYGYTSDSSGIRHALIENGQLPEYSEAKYMLVAASGFINYVVTKCVEADINI